MRHSGLRAFNRRWTIRQTRFAIEHPWREALIGPMSVAAGFTISWVLVGVRSWPGQLVGVLIGFVLVWCLRGRYNSGEIGKERHLARLQKLDTPAAEPTAPVDAP